MADVVVRSIGKETEVEIKPFKMLITFDEEHLAIEFEGAKQNFISLKGDTNFLFKGNINFMSEGEFGIITKSKKIYLDSINSQIHLNSRLSPLLKNLPESIEYRQEKKKEAEKKEAERIEQNENIINEERIVLTMELDGIKRRIEKLEDKNRRHYAGGN